jgi:hypothetical protein
MTGTDSKVANLNNMEVEVDVNENIVKIKVGDLARSK